MFLDLFIFLEFISSILDYVISPCFHCFSIFILVFSVIAFLLFSVFSFSWIGFRWRQRPSWRSNPLCLFPRVRPDARPRHPLPTAPTTRSSVPSFRITASWWESGRSWWFAVRVCCGSIVGVVFGRSGDDDVVLLFRHVVCYGALLMKSDWVGCSHRQCAVLFSVFRHFPYLPPHPPFFAGSTLFYHICVLYFFVQCFSFVFLSREGLSSAHVWIMMICDAFFFGVCDDWRFCWAIGLMDECTLWGGGEGSDFCSKSVFFFSQVILKHCSWNMVR